MTIISKEIDPVWLPEDCYQIYLNLQPNLIIYKYVSGYTVHYKLSGCINSGLLIKDNVADHIRKNKQLSLFNYYEKGIC